MSNEVPIETLIEALGNRNMAIREQAKTALRERGPSMIDTLAEIVVSGNKYQSYEAATILSEYHDMRCFDALSKVVDSPNVMVAQLASRTLMTYGKALAYERLLDALPRAQLLTQIQIVELLKEVGDQKAFQPLITILRSTDSAALRYCTIEALGMLGATNAISLIRSFKDDENHHVRDRVRIALERLEGGAADGNS
ncbi:MAG: hypothetical protein CL610_30315 [Anaerolineaceae bacterium]|nr:hypothetical protein [Anaerolineaceae bacterium]